MDHVYPGRDHPTDADLLERLLAREADPHLAHCARCAERAETIAREIDPLRAGSMREPFDEFFYHRQAARIRARIAAGEGRRAPRPWISLPALPRLAWVGGAVAALVVMAVALLGRAPVERGGGPTIIVASAGNGFP